jgi:hypothetical protein
MQGYKNAIVKFNSGRGALLCNYCNKIIIAGNVHVDTYHRCSTCQQELDSCVENVSHGFGEN